MDCVLKFKKNPNKPNKNEGSYSEVLFRPWKKQKHGKELLQAQRGKSELVADVQESVWETSDVHDTWVLLAFCCQNSASWVVLWAPGAT